jgi:hypothetical protein
MRTSRRPYVGHKCEAPVEVYEHVYNEDYSEYIYEVTHFRKCGEWATGTRNGKWVCDKHGA